MSDNTETEEQTREAEEELDVEATEETESEEVVVDLESAQGYDERMSQLEETVEEQREEIEELQDLLLDLSVRAADDRGMGVCPDCHGPVTKVKRWLSKSTIECKRCGKVYHEY